MTRSEFYAKVRVGLIEVDELYPSTVIERYPGGKTIWIVRHTDGVMYVRRNADNSWTWIS